MKSQYERCPVCDKSPKILHWLDGHQMCVRCIKDKLEIGKKVKPYPPRYDDVYFEGLKWLDTL